MYDLIPLSYIWAVTWSLQGMFKYIISFDPYYYTEIEK